MMKADALNGILLLNKPQGITSNKALQIVKKLYNAKKAGHTGSLDPLATGMLPICFGEATKFSQFLLDSDKCYIAQGMLGVTTTTQDSDGDILNTCESNIDETTLLSTLNNFLGEIEQIPSMYSAIKHQGKPLYKYARVGVQIDRKPRTIFIKKLELLEFDEQKFTIKVVCTKGTYIRNLVEDIGNVLGVGAHVTKLHRVYLQDFENMPMYSIEQLQEMQINDLKDLLLDIDTAVCTIQQIILSNEDIIHLHQGKLITINNEHHTNGLVRIFDKNQIFYGLATIDNQTLKASKLLSSNYLYNNLQNVLV